MRKLWQRGEAARGSLPTVPQLPPLPHPARSDTAAGSPPVRWSDYVQHIPTRVRPSSRECGPVDPDGGGGLFGTSHGIGAYRDGGVMGGGYEEAGLLGPVSNAANALPESLADL